VFLARLSRALSPGAVTTNGRAKLLRAAQNDTRLLVRVTVEVLLRTGLRVGEYTGLRADAVVLIGAAPWRHVPVGKLHDDRYLPLHPNLVTLIDDYRARHVPPGHSLLLPRENGRPLDRHTVTRMINKVGAAAGLGHIHPHQLRHTLATQAINRGMSLEAIAAMLGHRRLDMTLCYAKIANRTVADEYFAVTDKVEALYGQPRALPADAIGPKMARLRREHHRLPGNPPSRAVQPTHRTRRPPGSIVIHSTRITHIMPRSALMPMSERTALGLDVAKPMFF